MKITTPVSAAVVNTVRFDGSISCAKWRGPTHLDKKSGRIAYP
jgi:hypothetical protein